jgi:hypothetical protein
MVFWRESVSHDRQRSKAASKLQTEDLNAQRAALDELKAELESREVRYPLPGALKPPLHMRRSRKACVGRSSHPGWSLPPQPYLGRSVVLVAVLAAACGGYAQAILAATSQELATLRTALESQQAILAATSQELPPLRATLEDQQGGMAEELRAAVESEAQQGGADWAAVVECSRRARSTIAIKRSTIANGPQSGDGRGRSTIAIGQRCRERSTTAINRSTVSRTVGDRNQAVDDRERPTIAINLLTVANGPRSQSIGRCR